MNFFQKKKSLVAADAIKVINPMINVHAYVDDAQSETEHIYNDRFYEQLDGVVSALDNVKSRKYLYVSSGNNGFSDYVFQ
jgi:ubiquitin-activating enzyme E1